MTAVMTKPKLEWGLREFCNNSISEQMAKNYIAFRTQLNYLIEFIGHFVSTLKRLWWKHVKRKEGKITTLTTFQELDSIYEHQKIMNFIAW